MDKNKIYVTAVGCLIVGLFIGMTLKKYPPEILIEKEVVVDSSSIWGSIEESEQEKVYDVANEYVKNGSVPGMKYVLSLDKKVGDNWLVFHVIPISPVTDVAQLFLEKSNGVWVGRGLGTAFPGLYAEHPELFK